MRALIYASEALRMFLRRLRVAFLGVRRYPGSPEAVCRKIILDCYDLKKGYFRVSGSHGHFREFYCRDFGWCAESLILLGYRRQVLKTLDYALGIFRRHGRVEQTISPGGRPFTFPNAYSPDALAFLVHSLRLAGDRRLVAKYRGFIEQEARRYLETAVDPVSGLIRKGVQFSSMKDYSVRSSSCYDNVMTAMLKDDLEHLGLANPFRKYDYRKLIMGNFWAGSYFLDDLSGRKAVCADANILPFWSGVIADRQIMSRAIASLAREGLDSPFPAKYTSGRDDSQKMIWQETFAGDYERDAVWAHVGLMHIKVASLADRRLARKYLLGYERRIARHRNFLEVYDRDGRPFRTLLYYSDEGMLWAANFLALKRKLG